jgi:hypothetical protein
LCDLDRVSRDELIALLLGREQKGEEIWFWSAKAENTLLHAVSLETDLAESLSISTEPSEERQLPFLWR